MRGKGGKKRWEVKEEKEMRGKGGKKRWEVKDGKIDER